MLEDRTLLAAGDSLATAIGLTLTPTKHMVQGSDFLTTSNDFSVFKIEGLNSTAGDHDIVTVAVDAQKIGTGLNSYLRIFYDADGGDPSNAVEQFVNDDFDGRDSRITFQAQATGTYYALVSGFGNSSYDAASPAFAGDPGRRGLFNIQVSRQVSTAPLPDLVGAIFEVAENTAFWGEQLHLTYSLENRGALAILPFQVDIVLSADNIFDASDYVVSTFVVAGALDPGIVSSMLDTPVELPDLATALANGFITAGDFYVGLVIDTGTTAITEIDETNNAGVHRGTDWDIIRALQPVTPSGANTTPSTAQALDTNTRVDGVLGSDAVAWYVFSLEESGSASIALIPQVQNQAVPTLALYGQNDRFLLQSNEGMINKYLIGVQGASLTYKIAVLGQASDSYQLAFTYNPALPPFASNQSNGPPQLGDVNRDGVLDLITGSTAHLGLGNGSFATPAVAASASSFVINSFLDAVADVNNDGVLDIAQHSGVALGNGDGTYQPFTFIRSFFSGLGVVVADVNDDGAPDLVARGASGSGFLTYLGNGDGTFQTINADLASTPFSDQPALPETLSAGDFNGDGIPDLAIGTLGNPGESTVHILIGNGDGTFNALGGYATGWSVGGIVAGDLNNDGRDDLVVIGLGVGILIGNGDGSFRPFVQVLDLPLFQGSHSSLALADVDMDDNLDIVAAPNVGSLAVLLGNGDATFMPPLVAPLGVSARSIVVAKLTNDDVLDVAVVDANSVSVLAGSGNGNFTLASTITVGSNNVALDTADVDGINGPDLLVADAATNAALVLLNDGSGNLVFAGSFIAGPTLADVKAGDVDNDGNLDLVVAKASPNNALGVLKGNGNGTFQSPLTIPVGVGLGANPQAVVLSDFNRDGVLDMAAPNRGDFSVTVLLSTGPGLTTGGGTFSVSEIRGIMVRNTPFLRDVDGDGFDDVIIANVGGEILLRRGGHDGFQTPIVINGVASIGESRPVRDIAVVSSQDKYLIATADARFSEPLSGSSLVYTVSIYSIDEGSGVVRVAELAIDRLPTRIIAGDIDGDGLEDLIVATAEQGVSLGLDQLGMVIWQTAPGVFGDSFVFSVPFNALPSDVALVDVDNDLLLDVVVSGRASGTIYALLNTGGRSFGEVNVFQSGPGLATFVDYFQPRSLDQPVSMVVGDFFGDQADDLLVVNRGAHSLTVLPIDHSGLLDPSRVYSTSTSDALIVNNRPGVAGSGDFDNDDFADIAIIMEDRGEVWIYAGTGNGSFRHTYSIAVGLSATGLTVFKDADSGQEDLFVGNKSGDILRLLGVGDGTFKPFRNLDRVPFVTTDFNGDGRLDVVLANQSVDAALSALRQADANFAAGTFAQQGAGLLGPGAVSLVDLDGQFGDDLIVANSGSNNVLVYLREADGTFGAAQSFSAGTNPVGLTSVQLNDDNGDLLIDDNDIMDIAVANRGSNDVSVLFGQIDAGVWSLTPGPRLNVGSGPVNVSFALRPGDDIPDMIVERSDGTIISLPGIGSGTVGTGFFDDTNPSAPFTLGSPIVTPFVDGFIATATGIFQFDRSSFTANLLFASTALTSFTTTTINGNTAFFGGYADGSIRLIADADLDGEFAESLIFRDAQLTDPSALQVVDNNGTTEIYATSSGQSRVFVFGLSDGVAIPDNARSTSSGEIILVQPVSQAGIALVAVLVIGERGEEMMDMADSAFIVGLGPDGTPDAATLALLATLLTGTGVEEEGDVGGTEDMPAVQDERVTLEGFIAGVEEAVKRFQQQLAPMPEGDTPLTDWSRTLDQVFSRWAVTAHTAADLLQEPAERSAAWLVDDGGLGRGVKPPAGSSDDDASLRRALAPVEDSLQNVGGSVRRALREAFRPSGWSPWLSGNQSRAERLEGERPGEDFPLCWCSDWQTGLAGALVAAGLARTRSVGKHKAPQATLAKK